MTLRSLSPYIHHLERNFFNDEIMLYYPLRGFSGQQNILFAGEIVLQKKGEKHQKSLSKILTNA